MHKYLHQNLFVISFVDYHHFKKEFFQLKHRIELPLGFKINIRGQFAFGSIKRSYFAHHYFAHFEKL